VRTLSEFGPMPLFMNMTADTLTAPMKEMYDHGILSSLGDDTYHEPATIKLEAELARLTGKEAALFVPSGTMSNQLALRSHFMQPPYSVLYDSRCHTWLWEAGGAAFHSGAQGIPVSPKNRQLSLCSVCIGSFLSRTSSHTCRHTSQCNPG
jgi:threonine aldolase